MVNEIYFFNNMKLYIDLVLKLYTFTYASSNMKPVLRAAMMLWVEFKCYAN